LVVDALVQSAELGELRPAIAAGLMNAEQVHAELQDLVAAVAGEARAPAKWSISVLELRPPRAVQRRIACCGHIHSEQPRVIFEI
jgi:hypothetical protein